MGTARQCAVPVLGKVTRMAIQKVALEDMLLCREARAQRQSALIREYNAPVVCFTMNIPGEIKYTPLIGLVFEDGVRRLEAALMRPATKVINTSFTGCEAFFVFPCSAAEAKSAAVRVEENDAVARLYDIDVIDVNGIKLTRSGERRCIVCGGPVTACARSRAHGLGEITAAADALMRDFAAKKLARLAAGALTDELRTTPKPGLVDLVNNGAHKDMDKDTFYASIRALEPFFESMARIAFEKSAFAPEDMMEALRDCGMAAERAMFEATRGVNTHKGAIFSVGLTVAGSAKYLADETPALDAVRALARSGMDERLRAASENPTTNGERIYARTGATGALGEAADGFPAARAALDALRGFSDAGLSCNDAAALTLPFIMERLNDTNLIHRGGAEGLLFAQREAARINALPVCERLRAIEALDGEFIRRNLSPGGAADALALALFMRGIADFVRL